MNTRAKFYRVVVASSLGAVLWAACSSPQQTYVSSKRIPETPIDLLKFRPDTHPERRMGVTMFSTFQYLTAVPQTEAVPMPALAGDTIVEAAGAEPANSADLEAYRKELSDRACKVVEQN